MTPNSTAPLHAVDPAADYIECFNPATGERLGQVKVDTPDDVREAVAKAREAQKIWAKTSFKTRRKVLDNIMQHILAHVDELCEVVVKDSGKTFENTMLGEVMPICNQITWLKKNAEKYLKPEKVGSGLLMHKKARIEYLPMGVVACIIPWNYPMQNVFGSLVAPLMAGNAVLLKASEAVAWSSQRFQRIIDEALQKEGMPTDLVRILNGYGDTGAALVRARVDKILFIGSVGNGRRIIEGSAEHLTPVVMELGGKDPMIICDDANMEKAIHSALGGCFINLGQNCVASERIICYEAVYDEFVARIGEMTRAFRQGVPTAEGKGSVDVGAMVTPQQVAIVDRLVQDAVSKGAKLIAGGKRPEAVGNYYPPTILTDVTPEMAIFHEEIFGPVMVIYKVKGEQEAIALANVLDLGLHSSIITGNRATGDRIASQLQAGATCINDFGMCYMNQDLPFGGVKYSGFGRMCGRDGLRGYTNQKAVLADRFPIEIPPVLFPVGKYDYENAKSSVQLLFAAGLKTKLHHLLRLVVLSVKKKFAK